DRSQSRRPWPEVTERGASAEEAFEDAAHRAGVLVVLLLEALVLVVVGEREHELLAGGVELAGGAVQATQREVLDRPEQAAGVGLFSVLARVGEGDGL